MRVERAQMSIEDAAGLRTYLDEVTRIKLRALAELTHEDLRGDRLFSIFLMQCSALSRKIEAKLDAAAEGHPFEISPSAELLTPTRSRGPRRPGERRRSPRRSFAPGVPGQLFGYVRRWVGR
jgi:hypothetical protein